MIIVVHEFQGKLPTQSYIGGQTGIMIGSNSYNIFTSSQNRIN